MISHNRRIRDERAFLARIDESIAKNTAALAEARTFIADAKSPVLIAAVRDACADIRDNLRDDRMDRRDTLDVIKTLEAELAADLKSRKAVR